MAFAFATSNSGAGDSSGSIKWDGLNRTYLVHVPPSHNKEKAAPLLFVLHGGGGTGKGMVSLTKNGFNELADKEGFVVVYPDGIERHWNDGRGVARYRAHKENVDDVGFISALIEHLSQTLNIDAKRIYATGISNGGFFSQRLACELTDKIAAIAVVAAQMSKNLSLICKPKSPVSVLIMPGTKDPLVPYEGGEIGFPMGRVKLGKVLSVSETVKFWTAHNGCSSQPVVSWEPDNDPKDLTRVRKEVYSECKDKSEVVLLAIEGGGHTWPGGYQYLSEKIIGKTSRDIDANVVIWDFFKKHSRD